LNLKNSERFPERNSYITFSDGLLPIFHNKCLLILLLQ